MDVWSRCTLKRDTVYCFHAFPSTALVSEWSIGRWSNEFGGELGLHGPSADDPHKCRGAVAHGYYRGDQSVDVVFRDGQVLELPEMTYDAESRLGQHVARLDPIPMPASAAPAAADVLPRTEVDVKAIELPEFRRRFGRASELETRLHSTAQCIAGLVAANAKVVEELKQLRATISAVDALEHTWDATPIVDLARVRCQTAEPCMNPDRLEEARRACEAAVPHATEWLERRFHRYGQPIAQADLELRRNLIRAAADQGAAFAVPWPKFAEASPVPLMWTCSRCRTRLTPGDPAYPPYKTYCRHSPPVSLATCAARAYSSRRANVIFRRGTGPPCVVGRPRPSIGPIIGPNPGRRRETQLLASVSSPKFSIRASPQNVAELSDLPHHFYANMQTTSRPFWRHPTGRSARVVPVSRTDTGWRRRCRPTWQVPHKWSSSTCDRAIGPRRAQLESLPLPAAGEQGDGQVARDQDERAQAE